ncbi:MAG TPA: hypothetical protein VF764_04900 [Steroidobacteraceae bacterium]
MLTYDGEPARLRVFSGLGAQYAFITGGARRYLPHARTARLVSEPILPSNPAA